MDRRTSVVGAKRTFVETAMSEKCHEQTSTGHVDGEELSTEAAFSLGVNSYADGHRIARVAIVPRQPPLTQNGGN
jgi:hypothetical protein